MISHMHESRDGIGILIARGSMVEGDGIPDQVGQLPFFGGDAADLHMVEAHRCLFHHIKRLMGDVSFPDSLGKFGGQEHIGHDLSDIMHQTCGERLFAFGMLPDAGQDLGTQSHREAVAPEAMPIEARSGPGGKHPLKGKAYGYGTHGIQAQHHDRTADAGYLSPRAPVVG